MHGLEGFVIFHPQRRKIVDIEEPPPVDLVVRRAPPGEPVMLAFQQGVELLAPARRRRIESIERRSFELLAVRRGDWQGMLKVADAQSSTMRVLLELDLACRQRFPVCLAEYREQDLCAQRRVVRL